MEDSFCLNAFYVQYWASRQLSNKSMQNNACAYRIFFALLWLKVVLHLKKNNRNKFHWKTHSFEGNFNKSVFAFMFLDFVINQTNLQNF